MNEEQQRLMRLTVTHVVSVLAAVVCLCEGQTAVGGGCVKHSDCVSGAQCIGEKCVCSSGFRQLVDSSKCLNLAHQMVTTKFCKDNAGCRTVGGNSTCVKFTSTSLRCTCNSTSTLPSQISCFLACKNHKTCAVSDPRNVCMQPNSSLSTGPDISFCGATLCRTDEDCQGISGTTCQAQNTGSTDRYCRVKISLLGSNNTYGKLSKEFDRFLLMSVGSVGGVLLLLIITIILVVTGTCSGDLTEKKIRGRGVPVVRKRLAPFLGGGKPGEDRRGSAGGRRLSSGSRRSSRSASVNSIQMTPGEQPSNMSLSSGAQSSAYNTDMSTSEMKSSSVPSGKPSGTSLA